MARPKTGNKDSQRLRQAQGWLDLGSAGEALQELDQISSAGSSSIEALRARYTALASTEQWKFAFLVSEVAVAMFPKHPETWLWRAHAIRALTNSASEARDSLSAASDIFPDDPIIFLNLALYEAELGDQPKATGWLRRTHRAAQLSDQMSMVRQLVGQDQQLQELWKRVDKAPASDPAN